MNSFWYDYMLPITVIVTLIGHWVTFYSAFHENYDGAIDSHDPMGNGDSYDEAIADLKEQMEERGMRLYPKRVAEPTEEDFE